MEYILTVKTNYQISHDEYQVATKMKKIGDDTKVSEIMDWCKSIQGDMNTIQIHSFS